MSVAIHHIECNRYFDSDRVGLVGLIRKSIVGVSGPRNGWSTVYCIELAAASRLFGGLYLLLALLG